MKEKLRHTEIVPGSFFVKPVIVSIVLLAVSSVLWFFSPSKSQTQDYESTSPFRWLLSIALPIFIVKRGLRKKSLSPSGAVAGFFVGFFLTISNLCFCSSLLVFFITSSVATKFRSSEKKQFEEDFREGGYRNWVQVLCNGGVAAVLGLLYLLEGGTWEGPVDFNRHRAVSWLSLAVLGSLSCVNGDTWASELGTVLAKSQPRLITSWQPVPRGTNGGVTTAGLISSAAGGTVVGLGYYLTLLVCVDSFSLERAPAQWPLIIVGLLAGLFGSVVDSLLGATLQYSGQDLMTGAIVESPRQDVQSISGVEVLDNHSVNLIASFLTAIVVPTFAKYFF